MVALKLAICTSQQKGSGFPPEAPISFHPTVQNYDNEAHRFIATRTFEPVYFPGPEGHTGIKLCQN